MTKEILEEAGMRVDEEAFAKEMQAQKDRARKARGGEGYMGAAVTVYDELPTDLETKFAGYDVDTVVDAKNRCSGCKRCRCRRRAGRGFRCGIP